MPSCCSSSALGEKLMCAAALPLLMSGRVLLQQEPQGTAPKNTPRCACSGLATSMISGTPSPGFGGGKK